MTRLLRFLGVALLLAATVLVRPASASTWAAPAIAGVPRGESSATVGRNPPYIDGELGPSYVYLNWEGVGTGVMHYGQLVVPVTAPQGSAFNCLWLRASVPDSAGTVKAQLWRQPIKFTGTMRLLGEVTTVGTGNQTRAIALSTPITYLNMSINTYFLTLELYHMSSGISPKLYDVGLVQGTCPVQ